MWNPNIIALAKSCHIATIASSYAEERAKSNFPRIKVWQKNKNTKSFFFAFEFPANNNFLLNKIRIVCDWESIKVISFIVNKKGHLKSVLISQIWKKLLCSKKKYIFFVVVVCEKELGRTQNPGSYFDIFLSPSSTI